MSTTFIKEKLSRAAIDKLAKRCVDSNAKKPFPYTTATGERILVSPSKLILRKWS